MSGQVWGEGFFSPFTVFKKLSVSYNVGYWVPEGITIVPRTAEAPYGYGPPRRSLAAGGEVENPVGVAIVSDENNRLNQVLLNRYEKNKYPEFPGKPDEEGVTQTVPMDVYIPEGYLPFYWVDDGYEGPTEQGRFLVAPGKFSTLYGSSISGWGLKDVVVEAEEESTEWFAHWPEEMAPLDAGEDAAFIATNALRAAAGKLPLYRPLRGFGNAAFLACVENVQQVQPGVLEHRSDAFRQGFRQPSDRVELSFGSILFNENLSLAPAGSGESYDKPTSAAAGTANVAAWENSPPHYAAIINSVGNLYYSTGLTAAFTGTGEPIAQVFDEKVQGNVAAQVFVDHREWLMAGSAYQNTPFGAVSYDYASASWLFGLSNSRSLGIGFHGKFYPIKQLIDANEEGSPGYIIGAAIRTYNNTPWFVVLVGIGGKHLLLSRPVYGVCPDPSSPQGQDVQLYLWVEVASMDVTEDQRMVTRATFTSDGQKAVYTVTKNSVETLDTFFDVGTRVNSKYVQHFPVFLDGDTLSTGSLIIAPTMEYTLEHDTGNGYIYSYGVECDGEFSAYPFYDANDILQNLQVHLVLSTAQERNTVHSYAHSLSITFPSGNTVLLNDIQTSAEAVTTDSFLSSIAYLNPVTEDIVLFKTVFGRPNTTTITESTSVIANDSTIATFPVDTVSASFSTNLALGIYDTAELPMPTGRAINVYSLPLFFSRLATGLTYVSLPRDTLVTCGNSGYTADPGKLVLGISPLTFSLAGDRKQVIGSHPACMRRKQICNAYETDIGFLGFASGLPTTDLGGLIGVPNAANKDGVACWFVRYKEEYVVSALVNRYRQVDTAGVETHSASFDLNALVGIGELTSIYPVGAV